MHLMATTLVIGSDDGVLEGIAQVLATAGHRPLIARSLDEAAQLIATDWPLVALIERGCAMDAEFSRLRLPPGTALVLYRAEEGPQIALPATVQRMTLADLVLPWERQRLVALVQRLAERAQAVGRPRIDTPPETRAF